MLSFNGESKGLLSLDGLAALILLPLPPATRWFPPCSSDDNERDESEDFSEDALSSGVCVRDDPIPDPPLEPPVPMLGGARVD